MLLHGTVILATNLSYEEASKLLDEANKTVASQYYSFDLACNIVEGSWILQARSKEANRAFLKNPNDFTIQSK